MMLWNMPKLSGKHRKQPNSIRPANKPKTSISRCSKLKLSLVQSYKKLKPTASVL